MKMPLNTFGNSNVWDCMCVILSSKKSQPLCKDEIHAYILASKIFLCDTHIETMSSIVHLSGVRKRELQSQFLISFFGKLEYD